MDFYPVQRVWPPLPQIRDLAERGSAESAASHNRMVAGCRSFSGWLDYRTFIAVAYQSLVLPGPTADDPDRADFLRARAMISLSRAESDHAERLLRRSLDSKNAVGTLRRPEFFGETLLLAEALFGQGKHGDAFASFEEARSIVADFALPADYAWRKALEIWLKRAKDLGRTELAASLESEIAQASATPVQAITILEKFRIHPKANG